MVLVDEKTQDINKQLTLKYLNNMYQMREKLAQFETRKEALIEKLGGLSENVEKKLGDNQRILLDQVENQKQEFQKVFRE